MVLIIPFNFWYSNILPVLSYLVPTSVLGPLAHVLQQKLVPLVVVLTQPFLALTLSLFSLVRFLLWPLAHLFGAFLWPLSKSLFQLTLDWYRTRHDTTRHTHNRTHTTHTTHTLMCVCVCRVRWL